MVLDESTYNPCDNFLYEFITPASRLTICGGTLQASEGTLQAINDAMQRIEANGGAGAINEASC
jgi:hypothetical protein